ncbi:MAG: fumarylacetoacetate hydrolase [Comamonadaceae bacterium]|nr:fumarylacetoacetate hydrolase [Comamonadaceae bacterium]
MTGLDPAMSLADGDCGQQQWVRELTKTHGRPVGYKVALTHPVVQQRLGYPAPLRGVLLHDMLLAAPAEVPARFGSRPVFEADLLVEVRDAAINAARTPAEALAHVSRVIPFIELADLVIDPQEPLTGPVLLAVNAGARLGVLGASFAPTPADAPALAAMTVVVRDRADHDRELARGSGTAILGHPLNALRWLVQDLARTGAALRAGDLVSLGSFTAPLLPQPGMVIEVRYEGLPQTPTVSVRFTP